MLTAFPKPGSKRILLGLPKLRHCFKGKLRIKKILPWVVFVICFHTMVQWSLLGKRTGVDVQCLNSTEQQRLKDLTLLVAEGLSHLNQTYWLDFDCLIGAVTVASILPQYSHCDFGRLANHDLTDYFQQKLQNHLRSKTDIITEYHRPDLRYGRTTIRSGRLEVNIYSYVLDAKSNTLSVCYERIADGISIPRFLWHKMWRTGLPKHNFLPLRRTKFYDGMINVPRDAWGVAGTAYEMMHHISVDKCKT